MGMMPTNQATKGKSMSKVIGFLEAMGAAPALLPDQYAALVEQLDVGDAERDALIGCDAAALRDLLGGRPVMRCAIFEPQREPSQEPDQVPDQGGEEPDSIPDEDPKRA